jgi:hypothetical protein
MPPMRERREASRHRVLTPVNVSTVDRPDRVGMLDDVSAHGLAFHSRSRYQIGERLSVMFQDGDARRDVTGRVVRTSLETNEDAFFHHVTAVRLDHPLD